MLRSSVSGARRFSTTRPAQTKVAVLGAAGIIPVVPISFPYRAIGLLLDGNCRLGVFERSV